MFFVELLFFISFRFFWFWAADLKVVKVVKVFKVIKVSRPEPLSHLALAP